MPWQVRLDPEREIVETVYAGALPAPELKAAVRETLRVAKAHSAWRVFNDCTALAGGCSAVDLFEAVGEVERAVGRQPMREAMLVASVAAPGKDVLFWQAACENRGIQVRLFDDRERALAWLARA